MSKPQPSRVLSDDCVVTVDGAPYAPHEGEWVDLFRGRSVGELSAIPQLLQLQAALADARDDEDEQLRLAAELETVFHEVCKMLARRLAAWNWTDLTGRPLPQPDGSAEQLKALSAEEVAWLLAATRETTTTATTESEAA